jgi:hypothetical protein
MATVDVFSAHSSGHDVVCHPSGTSLYTCGSDTFIRSFSVDAASGECKAGRAFEFEHDALSMSCSASVRVAWLCPGIAHVSL